MIRKCLLTNCALIVLVLILSGCAAGEEEKKIDGLSELGAISVISREKGSGTGNVFAENLDIYDDETKVDLTKEDCQIADSSDEVVDMVESDPSAIGYVSEGSIGDSDKQIRRLTVSKDVLNRSFCLAYSGKLSEVEQEFITYIRSEGQKIVEKNYETVKKPMTFLSAKPTGHITIGGSSSMAGLLQELADAYSEINPNAEIEVSATDSSEGLTGVVFGTYDLGMVSRDLKDYESELLESIPIARDVIVVIVNKENPLEKISVKDLKEIYTGEITQWQELEQ